MKEIIVPKPRSDRLIDQLAALYETFKDVPWGEKLNFNLSKLEWAFPLLLLALSAYIRYTDSSFTVGNAGKINQSYLDAIKFPEGIGSIFSFEQHLRKNKTYIPISVLKKNSSGDRERIESLFGQMVSAAIAAVDGGKNAVYYPIAELVTNIFEHSKKEEGFIFGQFYPKKKYLDICIIDCGRGLANTYKEENNLELSDVDAIVEAVSGHSTKANKERGFGIRTSKQVVCRALGGGFIMLSGGAALISVEDKERTGVLPGFHWNGVIVSYRIPKLEVPVDITPYLE